MSNISENTVPMGQKIAFGLGMLANQMFPAVMGIFMVVLVSTHFGDNEFYVVIILIKFN